MAKFDFPYHKQATEYPESSFRVKLGNSYQYTAPPMAPDQRIFKLSFAGMKYFVAADGTIDLTTFPEINLGRLEAFYNVQKMNSTFTYPHPVLGELSVRFNKPLSIPEGLTNGQGFVEGLQLEFIEQPGLSSSNVDDLIQIQYVDFPS